MKQVRSIVKYVTGLVFFLVSVQLTAQDSGPRSIEERIAKVENITSKLPKISGYLNMRYQYSDADDSNSFDIRRMRVNFQGDISPSFDYRLQVEFANSPKILDAYIRWKINSSFNIEAGQFKFPFSLENPYGPTNLEVIDNSLVITALSGYSDLSGISANGRDVGVSFYGSLLKKESYNIIDYHVGIFNGAGINASDKNKSKDFSGMLSIHPIKDLTVAVSHYNGSTGAQDDTHQRVRSGAGVKYDDGKFLFRSEYIQGKTGAMKSEGAYGVFGYFVTPKFQPVVKYDYFKTDMSANNTEQNNYLLGFNYLPIKNIRLQLNYTRKTYAGDTKDFNYLAAQIVAIF